MQRTVTRRVDYEDEGELADSYDSDMQFSGQPPPAGHAGMQGYDADSLTMSMSPTSRFMEQPVLIDMIKDSKSTGSSHTIPGARGGRGNGRRFSMQAMPERGEGDLVKIEYVTPNMRLMVVAAVVGAALGGMLNSASVGKGTQEWIGELGRMYVNVMECLALPLIFTTVTICVAHLVIARKTKSVLFRMGLMFFIAAFLASCIAALLSYLLEGAYDRRVAPPMPAPSTVLSLQCPNELYFSSTTRCDGKQLRDAAQFIATNITGIDLKKADDEDVDRTVTYAQQIVGFFSLLFQQNITEAFTASQVLGVIIFAMFIGSGIVVTQDHPTLTEHTSYLFLVLRQTDLVLELILNWFMRWLPLGTVSALTYSIMTGSLTQQNFDDAMFLPITLAIVLVLHLLLVVGVGYFLLVRKNPLHFFWYLTPALVFIFASGNNTAAIPVMMRCIESSKQVSRTLAQYAVSIGTVLSFCGTAAYFVIACTFMAKTSGLDDKLTAGRVLLLILLSTLSSCGTPQVPGAGLTYTATVWRAVFGSAPPDSFAFVVAMEWLTSRMRRVHNITVVAFIARIIAEQLDETVEDEEDRAIATSDRGSHQSLQQL
ncbi:hypothetical protein ATCC90586_008829 [Pythium insidiosum]|nr:hypothetical protein ATCC90586_008829 [Pythium insidiosum]